MSSSTEQPTQPEVYLIDHDFGEGDEEREFYLKSEVDDRIKELETERNVAETRRGELARVLEDHHSPDVRYFAEQANRITELDRATVEAVLAEVVEKVLPVLRDASHKLKVEGHGQWQGTLDINDLITELEGET